VFLVRFSYRHCCVGAIMRHSGSHNAALGLLHESSFGSWGNLNLKPLVSSIFIFVSTLIGTKKGTFSAEAEPEGSIGAIAPP